MRENGFQLDLPEPVTAGQVLEAKKGLRELVSIEATRSAADALRLMHQHEISQLPVTEDGLVVGTLNELTLVKLLHDGGNLVGSNVRAVMGQPMPTVDEATDVSEVYRLLMAGYNGVIVVRGGRARGLVARIDLADFWAERSGVGESGRRTRYEDSGSSSLEL